MWEFLRAGGPFMILLVLTSLISVTFIIERGFALRWGRIIPPVVEDAVGLCQKQEDVTRLKTVCQTQPSTLSRLMITAIDHTSQPKEDTVDAIQTQARHEVMLLERGLVVLEIAVGVAPLLGLVGNRSWIDYTFRRSRPLRCQRSCHCCQRYFHCIEHYLDGASYCNSIFGGVELFQ